MVLTSAYFARDDHATVERYLESRLPWLEETAAVRFWTVTFLYYVGRAQWLQGNLNHAHETYARMSSIVVSPELPETTVSRALMRALLDISGGRYADADRALREAVAVEQSVRHCLAFGSASLLLAHLSLLRSRPQAAVSEIAPVLAQCERTNTPGLILREGALVVPVLRLAVERRSHTAFALRLLDLLGAGEDLRRAYVPETGETLTAREVEVLRLVAFGASNRAITQQLVITERTAKTHMTSILRKLNVTSRTQAAARARDLRLV